MGVVRRRGSGSGRGCPRVRVISVAVSKARLLRSSLAVFALALAVRLVFLLGYSSNPFFSHRGIDVADYHAKAVGLLDGTWPAKEAFFWPPFYSVFLSLLYSLVGQQVLVVTVVQLVLGAACCALICLVAGEMFRGRFLPMAAGLMCALSGTMIYHNAQLLPDTPDLFLQLVAVLALLRGGRSRGITWWALAGLAAGLSVINRGGMLLYLPVVLAWALLARPRESAVVPAPAAAPRARKHVLPAKRLSAFMVPVLLALAPVTWHNLRYDFFSAAYAPPDTAPESAGALMKRLLAGRFVLVSSNPGINFNLGNIWGRRDLNNVGDPRHFRYYRELIEEPATKGILSASGTENYFFQAALQNLAQRPSDIARLLLLKLRQSLSGDEIPRNGNPYAYRHYSFVLAALLWKWGIAFPAGIIIPLGLTGVVLSRRHWRRTLPAAGLLAVTTLLLLAFFVTSRYRLVPISLLSIYAAYALRHFVRLVRSRDFGALVPPGALLLALGVAANAGVGPMDRRHAFYERSNLSQALMEEGRLDAAEEQLQAALVLFPDYYEADYNLGIIAAREGKLDEAERRFRRALEENPGFAEARNNLGSLLAQRGLKDEARREFAEALRLKPDYAGAHFNLGRLLQSEGRMDEAAEFLRESVRLQPDLAGK